MDRTKAVAVPVCIDLDGTLTKTDTLLEGFLIAIKHRFLKTIWSFRHLLHGKAAWKKQVSLIAEPDYATLPYDSAVLKLVEDARSQGYPTYLVTAASETYAHGVARHLGLFDGVFASTEHENLKGLSKRNFLKNRFADSGYDYIGDSTADTPVLLEARNAYMVARASRALRRVQKKRHVIPVGHVAPNRLKLVIKQMRIYQWAKNLLVFVPLMSSHMLLDLSAVKATTIGFFAFGLVASATYIVNDLMDLPHDRTHPSKHKRPCAAGDLPIIITLGLAVLCFLLAVLLSFTLPAFFSFALLTYMLTTLTYTLSVKNIAVLDTLFLAGLYTLRIIAGAAVIQVVPSFWILAFSMFLFLSIALAKRYAELLRTNVEEDMNVPGRQYRRSDMPTILAEGSAAGYAAIVVLALYINNETFQATFARPEVLWLLCPLLLYWINKLWLNTLRDEVHDDPLVWALTNRVSRGITIVAAALFILATF